MKFLLFLIPVISYPVYSQDAPTKGKTELQLPQGSSLAQELLESVSREKGVSLRAMKESAEKVGNKDGSVEDKYLSALLSIYENLLGEKRKHEVKDNFDKVTKEGVFHPVALNLTGILKYHGVYYWKDVKEAQDLMSQSMQQGSSYAPYNKAYMYFMKGDYENVKIYAEQAADINETQILSTAATMILEIRKSFFDPDNIRENTRFLFSDISPDILRSHFLGGTYIPSSSNNEGNQPLHVTASDEQSERLKQLLEKAREGFVQAQYTLGFSDWAGWLEEEHFFKEYSRQSKPYGPNWLKHAATASYPPALSLMTVVTYYGVSAYFNPEEGEPSVLSANSDKSFSGTSPLRWAYRARTQGSPYASYNIAYMYFMEGDFENAKTYAEEAGTFEETGDTAELLLFFINQSVGIKEAAIQSVPGMLFEDIDQETLSKILNYVASE